MFPNSIRHRQTFVVAVMICLPLPGVWMKAAKVMADDTGPETPVYFADPRFRAIVEDVLGIENPTPTDMLSLTVLNANDKAISSITGLQYARNLHELALEGNHLSDISPLEQLQSLTVLNLSGNSISDIRPLANLTTLKELYLASNQIRDISALSRLAELTRLMLYDNQVADIGVLANLTAMDRLNLTGNQITDISALAPLRKLTRLALIFNRITDVSALEQMKELIVLELTGNGLTNISPLGGLTSLQRLYLGGNAIVDVSALARLTQLTLLDLSSGRDNNPLTDISALAGLTGLQTLCLGGNRIADISWLRQLQNLTTVDLADNCISDISALAPLTHLSWLRLRGNPLTDIASLATLTSLEWLSLGGTGIADISALAPLQRLKQLYLYGNSISDISALSGLTELTALELYSNQISDLSALAQLTKLATLDAHTNYVSSVAALAGLIQLTDLDLAGNRIPDIVPLMHLMNLRALRLSVNQIGRIPALAELKGLTTLYLDSNHLSDIAGLAGLTKLRKLYLHDNRIVEIAALAPLTQLTTLYLSNNAVTNISALAPLTQLTTLYLDNNRVADISPLAGLTCLRTLHLDFNRIGNVSALNQLTQLTTLSLSENIVTDASALAPLTQLTTLYLDNNCLTDISPLAGLTALEELYLSSNRVADISVLAQLTQLATLHLDNNRLTDISSLVNLTGLCDVRLSHNEIAHLAPLARLTQVTTLSLDHNRLTDVSPLANLTCLRELYLGFNQIADVSALAQLTQLATLHLDNNRLTDISSLANLTGLTELYLNSNQITDVSVLEPLSDLAVVDLRKNPFGCPADYAKVAKLRGTHPFSDIRYDPPPDDCGGEFPYKVLFVDSRARADNNGSSWHTAIRFLQDALARATYGDEIRVAQGTYRPDQGSRVSEGDRLTTFELRPGVTLKGGYVGLGAGSNIDSTRVDPNARDIEKFRTILSGDLAGNDVGDWDDPSKTENSLHVVSAGLADSSTTLDGFVITAGHANDTGRLSDNRGGGMIVYSLRGYNDNYPNVVNCTFMGNYASSVGGGAYCESVNLVDCRFLNNRAQSDGGGVSASFVNLRGCLFQDNLAGNQGGGFHTSFGDVNLADCVFTGNSAYYGGAIFSGDLYTSDYWRDYVLSGQVTIQENGTAEGTSGAGMVTDVNVSLAGDLDLQSGRLDVRSSLFDGPGTIDLGRDAVLRIMGWPGSDPTIVRTTVNGVGRIEIDPGQRLIIEGNSVVDLSGGATGTPDPNGGGHILVQGSLTVQGSATLRGANISVKLLDVNTPNGIQYNNITLQEASTGFGGEFFVSGDAKILHNDIVSEGDRYLDMDPDPNGEVRPVISDNRVTVVIKEGKQGSKGTLLELRAKDYDAGTAVNLLGNSGAYQTPPTSPGFTRDPSANWVLERLILEPKSKLNLTNRQGFEFQSPCRTCERSWETVYVKELVMARDAILNTGLQTLYYQRLVDPNGQELIRNVADASAPLANGARLMDVPVLGFSLGVIAMDDPTPSPNNEFDIRVRCRVIDPNDHQTGRTDPHKIGTISRMDNDPGIPNGHGGVMDMRTRAPGKESARSVAAKGAFARAGHESITIEFEYLFQEDPRNQAEMLVFLSDDPEVGRRLVPVARILPPLPGRPGSIGSGRFAVFSATVPRGDLNFKRGTYVELELRGDGARCWIDDWDPKVNCMWICGDYSGDLKVDIFDYLFLAIKCGINLSSSASERCLDLNGDGYVNVDDLHAWTVKDVRSGCSFVEPPAHQTDLPTTRSPISDQATLGIQSADPIAPLVVLGKPPTGSGALVPNSRMWYVHTDASAVGGNETWSSAADDLRDGRLIVDGQGRVYQISSDSCLVRQDDKQVVMRATRDGQVRIGVKRDLENRTSEGFLLLDCAFHPQDPSIVYVVPVWVYNNGLPYMTAAKLKLHLTGDGSYDVLGLYGCDPADLGCQQTITFLQPANAVGERDTQHLFEIEISPDGRYVFVLNRQAIGSNNRVLAYEEAGGPAPCAITELSVPAPTAMLISADGKRLYLASSPSDPNGLVPVVYRFAVIGPNLAPEEGVVEIAFPANDQPWGRGSRATITSMTENPRDGTLYAIGFTAPNLPTDDQTMRQALGLSPWGFPQLCTKPVLATFSPESDHAQVAVIKEQSNGLTLPLSIVWTGP